MPTYDYQCQKCEVAFELFQSFSEDALKNCPTKKSGNSPEGCVSPGKGKVVKVFSAPGIAFKGSGFYKTDSRSGTSKSTSSSSSSSDSGSSTDSSTKSESSSTKSDTTSTKKSDSSSSKSTTASKD